MSRNPYQSPALQSRESELDCHADSTGISHKDYLQFRRAVAVLITTMATFFILFCVQMMRDSMYVEAVIASGFWLTMLVGVGGFLRHRTANEAKLTMTQFRAVSSSMPHLCFWVGPAMLVCGILQAVYVPTIFQFNAWGFIICGIAAFGCAFHWPRV